MSHSLGICTMPGCLTQAFWVDGMPIESENGDIFPWELCNECMEVAVAAGHALDAAGIPSPEAGDWCLEAARSWNQRMIKLEALKKQ